jgi:uncharacterized protein (DUF1697 family)
MAAVVLLRGVNVGGHRTFRPTVLARELSDYEAVNIGATGTFVIWKPGSVTTFRAELLRKLPFAREVVVCEGRDLISLANRDPFGTGPPRPDVVRFVSFLPKSARVPSAMPMRFPPDGEWSVRLLASDGDFILGEYRRHMKTIGYVGEIDKLVGTKVTTRNWNTILTIVRVLKERGRQRKEPDVQQ